MAGTIYEAIHYAVFSNFLLLSAITAHRLINTVPKPSLHHAEIPVPSAGEENIPLITTALVFVPSSTHTDTVISHFVIWTSLRPLS